MNYIADAKDLVRNLNQKMNPSHYDMAWMAQLRDADGRPRWPDLIDWLIEHQHPDGSWGGHIEYYHDRIISTLTVLIALQKNGHSLRAQKAIKSAEEYVWNHLHLLHRDPFELAGFELLLPTLLEEARELNIDVPSHTCGYGKIQTAKLRLIPPKMLYSPHISTVYSLEFLGEMGDVAKIRQAKTSIGSIANSPATTAYYLSLCEEEDRDALAYLKRIRDNFPDIVTVYPFRIFELVWVLNNLLYAGLDITEFAREEDLQFLKEQIGRKGVGFDSTFTVTDGDTTSVCYRILLSAGYQVDLTGLTYFEDRDTHIFRTWDFERNASVSANVHVLEALNLIPDYPEAESVKNKIVLMLLDKRVFNIYWTDKWHASPYYATSHALMALLKEQSFLAHTIHYTIDWLVHTQRPDGSWGFFKHGTLEETAYVLTALLHYNRHTPIDADILHRGAEYLMQGYSERPVHYPELWIAKCLYSPDDVVCSAIQAAIILYLKDFG